MTPPINIDGTQITGATIDGTDVTAITVDGTEVFAPVQIPDSGLLHDWEASNFNGSTWTNAAAAADLSVSSGSPTLQSNGINGEPAVSFDGAGDELNTTDINQTTPFVIFAVVDLTDNGAIQGLFSNADGSARPNLLYRFDSSDAYRVSSGGNVFEPGPIQAGQQINSFEYNGSNTEVRVNDSTVGTGSVGSDTLDNLLVGEQSNPGGRNLNGLLARLMIYDRSQMFSGQVSDVNNALNDIYGVF